MYLFSPKTPKTSYHEEQLFELKELRGMSTQWWEKYQKDPCSLIWNQAEVKLHLASFKKAYETLYQQRTGKELAVALNALADTLDDECVLYLFYDHLEKLLQQITGKSLTSLPKGWDFDSPNLEKLKDVKGTRFKGLMADLHAFLFYIHSQQDGAKWLASNLINVKDWAEGLHERWQDINAEKAVLLMVLQSWQDALKPPADQSNKLLKLIVQTPNLPLSSQKPVTVRLALKKEQLTPVNFGTIIIKPTFDSTRVVEFDPTEINFTRADKDSFSQGIEAWASEEYTVEFQIQRKSSVTANPNCVSFTIEFLTGDGEKIPCKPNSFDIRVANKPSLGNVLLEIDCAAWYRRQLANIYETKIPKRHVLFTPGAGIGGTNEIIEELQKLDPSLMVISQNDQGDFSDTSFVEKKNIVVRDHKPEQNELVSGELKSKLEPFPANNFSLILLEQVATVETTNRANFIYTSSNEVLPEGTRICWKLNIHEFLMNQFALVDIDHGAINLLVRYLAKFRDGHLPNQVFYNLVEKLRERDIAYIDKIDISNVWKELRKNGTVKNALDEYGKRELTPSAKKALWALHWALCKDSQTPDEENTVALSSIMEFYNDNEPRLEDELPKLCDAGWCERVSPVKYRFSSLAHDPVNWDNSQESQ